MTTVSSQGDSEVRDLDDEKRSPSSEDVPIVVFDEDDADEAAAEYENSLVGKFLTEMPIHKGSLFSALSNIWCSPKGFRLEEVCDKTYLIRLDDENDAKRICQGSPWVFRNSWLLIKPWNRHLEPTDMVFKYASTWIQLWGLPLHCRTVKIGAKIGASVGEVLDVDLFELPDKKIIVKVLVELDVMKPLMPGIYTGNQKDGLFWVDFKYEKLPQFCYFCGIIGHSDQFCHKILQAGPETYDASRNLCPFLRATMQGRKVMDKKNSQNPSSSHRQGQVKRVFTSEILGKLASFTMQNKVNKSIMNTDSMDSELGLSDLGIHQQVRGDNVGLGNEDDTMKGKHVEMFSPLVQHEKVADNTLAVMSPPILNELSTEKIINNAQIAASTEQLDTANEGYVSPTQSKLECLGSSSHDMEEPNLKQRKRVACTGELCRGGRQNSGSDGRKRSKSQVDDKDNLNGVGKRNKSVMSQADDSAVLEASTAESHENIMLELPRAWEPSCRTSS